MSRTTASSKNHPGLRVSQSKIQGRGVFAKQKFRKGQRLFRYEGEIIDGDEADRRLAKSKHVYLFDLEDGTYMDGDQSAPATMVNHSCDPNLEADIVNGEVRFIALKTIFPGEELTLDYQFDPDYEHTPCRCGVESCRGSINLIEEEA